MVRLEQSDRDTLDELARSSGIKAAELARMAVQAMLKEFRTHRQIIVPLRAQLSVTYPEAEDQRAELNDPQESTTQRLEEKLRRKARGEAAPRRPAPK